MSGNGAVFIFHRHPHMSVCRSNVFFPFSCTVLLSYERYSRFVPRRNGRLICLICSRDLLSLFRLTRGTGPRSHLDYRVCLHGSRPFTRFLGGR